MFVKNPLKDYLYYIIKIKQIINNITLNTGDAVVNSSHSIPAQNDPPSPYRTAIVDEQSFSKFEIAFFKFTMVSKFNRFLSSGLFKDIKVIC